VAKIIRSNMDRKRMVKKLRKIRLGDKTFDPAFYNYLRDNIMKMVSKYSISYKLLILRTFSYNTITELLLKLAVQTTILIEELFVLISYFEAYSEYI